MFVSRVNSREIILSVRDSRLYHTVPYIRIIKPKLVGYYWQGIKYAVKCKKTSSGRNLAASSNPLKQWFVGLSNQKRLSIQSKLSNLGFYQSTIDGIYGSKTEAAINDYAKSIGKEDHLNSEKLAKELLISLISTSEEQNNDESKTKKGLF